MNDPMEHTPAPETGEDAAGRQQWDTLRGQLQAGRGWEAVAGLTAAADTGVTYLPSHPVVGGIAHWFWDPAERFYQGPLAPALEAVLRLCPPLLRPMCGRARTVLQVDQGQKAVPDMALRAALVLIRGVALLDDPPLPASDVHACLDHALKTFYGLPGQEPLWRGLVLEALIDRAIAVAEPSQGPGKAVMDCLLLQWHGLEIGTYLWFAAAAPLIRVGNDAVKERVTTFLDDASGQWGADDAWRLEPVWPLLLHTPFATGLRVESLRRLRPLAHRWWYCLLIDLYLTDLHEDAIATGAVEAFLRGGPEEPDVGTGSWPFQCVGDYLLCRGRVDDCVRLLEQMAARPALHWEHPGFASWFAAWFPEAPRFSADPTALTAMIAWLRQRLATTR